jgi:tRNA pseudouridine55 synthase
MDNNNSGFLLINKPSGPTSHDIINKLRAITGIKKIGHAGTLDPFASGLLICAVGREATREIDKFVKLDKEYIATLHLGAVTDTYDRTGKVVKEYPSEIINEAIIEKTVAEFIGGQLQTPPMFSAKKIQGKKMYELARQGKTVERQPCAINIMALQILSYDWPALKLKINCSSGTYIRTLAFDLGERLGSGAYLEELERTKIGEYSVEDAIRL